MHKLNQKGFGLIEGLLVIIAITLIAFTGYYIWHQQSQDDESGTVSQTSVSSSKSDGSTANSSTDKEQALKEFMLKTCSSSDASAVKAVFENQSTQSVDTDSININNNYAIANLNCELSNGTQLRTLFMKYSSGEWKLLIKTTTGVSCDYLTSQGFPDDLKAPYCQNQEFNPTP